MAEPSASDMDAFAARLAELELTMARLVAAPRPDPNEIMNYFSYAHLPDALREVSQLFAALASDLIVRLPPSAERSVALRKLLEGKDAAVRCMVPRK